MRIDRLRIKNFKAFTEREIEFHPRFNLLIGENGSGKTTILDAVAVALGAWTYVIDGYDRRDIEDSDVHLKSFALGESQTYEPQFPVEIEAFGTVLEPKKMHSWSRSKQSPGEKTVLSSTAIERKTAGIFFKGEGERVRQQVQEGGNVILPLIACYGAGRVWKRSVQRVESAPDERARLSRFEGYRDCFHSAGSKDELNRWIFKQEAKARGGNGSSRIYRMLKTAILRCVPDSSELTVDFDTTQAAIRFKDEKFVLLDNLSDGQRTMVTLVGDLARRAITLNPSLEDRALEETPGVVLIDELDLHLHPRWQRCVVDDLKRVFPNLQFICTSHSPFIVQTLDAGELRPLQGEPIPDVGRLGIESISKGLMGVKRPEAAPHYLDQVAVAKHYLETVEEAAKAPEEKLADYERELAESISQYAENPAFQAFLEMKREARLGPRRQSPGDRSLQNGA